MTVYDQIELLAHKKPHRLCAEDHGFVIFQTPDEMVQGDSFYADLKLPLGNDREWEIISGNIVNNTTKTIDGFDFRAYLLSDAQEYIQTFEFVVNATISTGSYQFPSVGQIECFKPIVINKNVQSRLAFGPFILGQSGAVKFALVYKNLTKRPTYTRWV